MSPYRTTPEVKPLALCPRCNHPTVFEWYYAGGKRQLEGVSCRKCGWRLAKE